MGAVGYPDASSGALDAVQLSGDGDQVALLRLVGAVRVGKVDVAARVLHDAADRVAAAADDVRVVRVAHLHLQRHSIALLRNVQRSIHYFIHSSSGWYCISMALHSISISSWLGVLSKTQTKP